MPSARATGVAHAFGTEVAWLLAPLAATVTYLGLVGVQVEVVNHWR